MREVPAWTCPGGRTSTPQSAISVRYTLGTDGAPGTSDADGSDYTDGGGGAVEIAAGASGVVIEITINDDEEIESAREVFALTLDTPRGDAGYALGVVATAAVTIEEGVCDRTPSRHWQRDRTLPEPGNEMTSAMDSGCCTLLEEDGGAAISCCIVPTPKPILPQWTCSVYCTTPWLRPANHPPSRYERS